MRPGGLTPQRPTRSASCWALLAGCAATGNELARSSSDAGFWLGLWHGFISPVTFIVS